MRCARTASVILAGLTFAAVAVTSVIATTAGAQQAPGIAVKPAAGPPGGGFTITFRGFRACRGVVYFAWDNVEFARAKWAELGSVEATVPPDADPGLHIVVGRNECQDVARTTFTVLIVTTVPTTADPTTTPVPTTAPTATTTRRTTTRPSPTTTTTSDTTPPPTSTEASPTVPAPERPGGLTFDKPSVQAGEKLSASGAGCIPGEPVTLASDGELVGGSGPAVMAGSDGRFTAAVEFRNLRPGRREVIASCGTVLTGVVDLALTSSTGGSSSTLVVLVFFLLAGVTVLTRPKG